MEYAIHLTRDGGPPKWRAYATRQAASRAAHAAMKHEYSRKAEVWQGWRKKGTWQPITLLATLERKG